MKIYDRRMELMPRDELQQLQLERLQALLARIRRTVRRYREELYSTRIASLADLSRLPITSPEDVAESFPYGLFALPLREVIRLDSTVGPLGRPLVTSHTRNDLDEWGRLVARQLVACGVTANDILQVCLGGIYWGASGYVRGAEMIEASIIAEDPFHVGHQLAMLNSFRPTVLVTTPTNALELLREMDQRKMEAQSLSLRTVLLSRPIEPDVLEQLKAGFLADVRCNFGVAEVLDPGLCVQCEHGSFHVNEDHFLCEVVDGELIMTTLAREAMPLLRYRTRIACEAHSGKCPCGRTGMMLKPGPRLDGRLLVSETPLYETQIAATLKEIGLGDRLQGARVCEQHIEIELAVTDDLFSDTVLTLNRLSDRVESEFFARFGIEAKVRLAARQRN